MANVLSANAASLVALGRLCYNPLANMEDQVRLFLDDLSKRRGCSENTIQAYRNDLTQLLNFVQIEKPYVALWSRVDKPLLITFLSHLSNREYTPASISRKVAVIKTFFHFLLHHRMISDDPSSMLPAPRVEKKMPQILSPDDIARLLDCPSRENSPKGLRDTAILELFYATGMRVSEIVSLDVADVNLAESAVMCNTRSSKRTLPITRHAVEAIENYLQHGRPIIPPALNEPALFLNPHGERLTRQGLWLIIKGCVKAVGIKTPVTPNTLRHSFAVHLLNRGEDVARVQQLLGHINAATTQAYVRLIEASEAAERVAVVEKG